MMIPVAADSRISRDNILQLKGTGLDGVVVISKYLCAEGYQAAAQELRLSEKCAGVKMHEPGINGK